MAITGDISTIKLPDNNEYSLKDKTQTRSDHRHYENDLVPLVSKVYASTSYYATTTDFEGSSWYFMSVRPDDWYKPWSVKLKFYSYCPNYTAYKSFTDSTISGRTGGIIYANWNETNSTTAHCYVTVYPLKKVGYDAGFGHAIAISIYGASNYNNSNYYRTFEVDFLECENCTVTILDTPVKWSNWTGTGTTNYESLQSLNATTRGLQESGDANTVTENRIGYFAGKTGTKGIWAGSFFMETSSGTFENICTASDGTVTSSNRTTATTKIANTTGFRVGSPIWYSNTNYNANTNIAGASVVYSSISAIESRYGFNTTLTTESLTPYVLLYLVGTIHSDGLFYLDPVWWTQTPNDRSKIYILFGGVYDSTTSNCRVTLYEQNKWYRYDGTKLVELVDESTDVNCIGYVSGTIAHFSDGAEDVPMKSVVANIVPIQSGTGTPSPSNPRPISGTDELTLTQTGKNLLDISQFASLYPQYCTYEDDVLNVQGQTILYTKGIEVKAPTGAKLSATVTDITSVNARFRLYYTDGTYSDVYPNQLPFSLLKDLASVRLNWSTNGTFKIENAQIEIGSTATTYEPYNAETYTIDLGQEIIGGTADVVGGTGSVTMTVIDLGDLTWTKQNMQNGSGFTARIEDGNPIGNVNSSGALCENYPEDTSVQNAYYINDKTFKYGGTYFGRRNITILDSDLSNLSAAEFKTTMSGVKLCYPLETPTSFTFTGQPIRSLLGVNNVWTDSGEVLDVEYYKNSNIIKTIIALNTKVSVSVSDTTLNIITQ